MPHKFIGVFLLCFALMGGAALAAEPELSDYQATPHWVAPTSIPMVLLVMSKDQKMFRHAYSPGDHNGDGQLDIGFNPETKYLGYFDSESCYEYDNGRNAGYFKRVGYATEKGSKPARPGGMDEHIKIPENKYGVCRAENQWHGNWLNFVMTSRIDAIKKVLYGGTREIDKKNETVLTHSYIPKNAMVWGYDVMGDDVWSERTSHLPYYNSSYYMGVKKPDNGKMHFFARYTEGLSSESLSKPPLFQGVYNIPARTANRDGTNFRVWNWTMLGDGTLPASSGFTNAGLNITKYTRPIFNARVRVCQVINRVDDALKSPPEGESCKQYPNGQYKPFGLMQEYGDSMNFGLMTGTAQQAAKRRGGVLRHHIDSINKAVDSHTGVLINKRRGNGGSLVDDYADDSNDKADRRADLTTSNIIRTMDKLTVTSWVVNEGYQSFIRDWTSHGNPMGEMLFEAVRYFGFLARPDDSNLNRATTAFWEKSWDNYGGAFLSGQHVTERYEDERADLYPTNSRPLPLIKDWKGTYPKDGPNKDCATPVILMISDIDNTFDGDDLKNINGLPVLSNLNKNSFPDFSQSGMKSYLKKITDNEGYAKSGKNYYYAKDPNVPNKPGDHNDASQRAVCQPRKVDDLSDVIGLCPNEPSLEGSYSMAAVAHFARTHNFSLDGVGNKPLSIYTVGVTPSLPPLTFTIPGATDTEEKPSSITIMPTGALAATRRYLLSFIGYVIEDWNTDDKGTPYKIRINVNYPDESEVYVRYSDYEQDSTSIYEINLVTDASTQPVDGDGYCHAPVCRESEPIVIHSGPLKGYDSPETPGCGDNPWSDPLPAASCDPVAKNPQPQYYRFARGKGGPDMEIKEENIKGMAVTSMILMASTDFEIALGYSITGTKDDYDGTYLEAVAHFDNQWHYPIGDSSTIAVPISTWEEKGSPHRGYRPGWSPDPIQSWATGVKYRRLEYGRWVDGHWVEGRLVEGRWVEGHWVEGYWDPTGWWNYSMTDYITDGVDDRFIAFRDPLLTPMSCKGTPAFRAANPHLCGVNARQRMRALQTRSFEFADEAAKVDYLPSPMELAAKYGGFSDPKNIGLPDNDNPATWAAQETKPDGTLNFNKEDGSPVYGKTPKNYFYVANLSSLSEKLGQAFEAIANSVSTGTSNSASISEVLGGGITVKTQYHSIYPGSSVKWLGNVYSLFIDAWARQHEDTFDAANDDRRQLDPAQDKVIKFEAVAGSVFARIRRYLDSSGRGGTPPESEWETLGSAEDIKHVWNVSQWLMDQVDVIHPRAWQTPAKGTSVGRRVYSYFPNQNDAQSLTGGAAWNPVTLAPYLFEPSKASDARLQKLLRCSGADGKDCAERLIKYTLGQDDPADKDLRQRSVVSNWSAGVPKVWRLGDVMNSRPIISGEPSGGFNFLYNDKSYADFSQKVAGRRNVVYFGSNDGILHAVNAGFYGSLKLGQAAYSTKPVAGEYLAQTNIPAHDLGAEIWGFIPQSILPHLAWLARPDADHVYTVDLSPTIVDMRIGTPTDKYKGWRTVLIGGLRLGGRSIDIGTDDAHEYIHSEFFALDITEPDEEPKLLWSYSAPDLGQTVSKPAVAQSGGQWYVILPSGPTTNIVNDNGTSIVKLGGREAYDGESLQKARLVVLNAKTGYREDSKQLVADKENSFFNSAFMPMAMKGGVTTTPGAGTTEPMVNWNNHAVYLGLSAAGDENKNEPPRSGGLYRLQMVDKATGKALPPGEWKLDLMFDAQRPITGAVNATYDTLGNLWVVFGSGRLWSREDAMPCVGKLDDETCQDNNTQYFYGIKEALNADGTLAFTKIPNDDNAIMDVSGYAVYSSGAVCDTAKLPQGQTSCTPGDMKSYSLIAAELKTDARSGYKRALDLRDLLGEFDKDLDKGTFEMIDTQAQLDARAGGVSNAVVTVYAPSGDICRPEGEGFLLIMDTFTGLFAPYMSGYVDLEHKDSGTVDENGNPVKQVVAAIALGGGKPSGATVTNIGNITAYTGQDEGGGEGGITLVEGGAFGTISWSEVVEMGLNIDPKDYSKGLGKEPEEGATP